MNRQIIDIRKLVCSLCLWLVAAFAHGEYFVVTGGSGTPVMVEQSSGDTSERIEVYLVYGSSNITISYTSSTTANHEWYRYKTKRLEAESVSSTQSGTTSTITNVEEGYGYFVEEGAVSRYVWIIDYSKHLPTISQLYVGDSSDPCAALVLAGSGTIEPMYYYWPNTGTQREVKRQYDVVYNTLDYDSDSQTYTTTEVSDVIEGDLFGAFLTAPWCDTDICVSGDYFARHFGKEISYCIEDYQAVVVDAHIDTVLVAQEAENMNTTNSGYCAPAEVEFSAIANTPTAALFSWTIYPSDDEDNPILRYTGESMDYTFNTAGSFVVKLEVTDQTTICSVEDEVEIDISESYLQVPNAFSPGTTPGVNDEFKVAYKSLVKFKAWIFNRWGQQLFYWTDPSQGWDGKKGGKYVQPGVYFYVIEAEGSDGIKYKKKGDINILRPKSEHNESTE